MKFYLSAPSKTFLTGEYAVLVGGSAIVLNTPPRFTLVCQKEDPLNEVQIAGIPEGSPAAVWINQRQSLLQGWRIEFRDPHEQRGGFGASGAQFLLVHSLTTLLQHTNLTPQLKTEDVFNDYQVCSRGSGSGADILAQAKGGAALVDIGQTRAKRFDWPYPELGFGIVRTGIKIPTHLHLQNLKHESLKELVAPAESCARAFGVVPWREFVELVKNFEASLRGLDLQAAHTTDLLKNFKGQSWCLAAKGCGAWGADTILLLFEKSLEPKATKFAEAVGLPFVANNLSGGLEITYEAD